MKKFAFVFLLAVMALPAAAQENMTFGHPNPNQNNTYQIIKGAGNSNIVTRTNRCQIPQGIINKSIDDINGMKFNHAVRIIHPNEPVTMDYNPDRLNIILDYRNIIRELRCG